MDENKEKIIKDTFDVIVVGAGAAGLFCASVAGQKGLKVLVLEHNKTPGRKILISGGGRCNFTHLNSQSEDYYSENKHFCKSSLAQYPPEKFLDLVDASQIRWVEKDKGQLFCEQNAKEIVDLLLAECKKGGVEILYDIHIEEIVKKENIFIIESRADRCFTAQNCVLATGGLSLKEIGASDFGYKVARSFGHTVTHLFPALVPLLFPEELSPFTSLSGISTEVKIKINQKEIVDHLLFTKVGVSGPAVLKSSLFFSAGDKVEIDLLPRLDLKEVLLKERERKIDKLLKEYLPKRLVDVICEYYKMETKIKLAEISKKDKEQFSKNLKEFCFTPKKTGGYRKAEVTRGGISCHEVHSKTLESKKVKGLYFIGEVLDVTGQLGGHNFQWAWSSGYACAQSLGPFKPLA